MLLSAMESCRLSYLPCLGTKEPASSKPLAQASIL